MIDIELELQQVNQKAYDLEQECARYEIVIEKLRNRIASLETELADLNHVDTIDTECENCYSMFQQPKRGRRARFCSNACRQENYRTMKLFAETKTY